MTVQISSITGGQANLAMDPGLVITQLPHAVGNLNILGGLTQHVTVPSSYPYNVLVSDNIIAVNTSATANTINLPATPATGNTYIVKDATGTAATHNITVSGNGNNIDGASTYVMNVNSQGAAFIFGATQWGVLSASNAIALPLSLANGGTNASLTASNGGIFYSSSTAGAILAGTATANQILMSGSSTTPAWSTATYPATAGTSGNILTSDGTNWNSSAAPAGGITTVGNVTSGSVAFNGTAGTTLTSTTAGFTLTAASNSGGVGGAVAVTGGATSNATSAGGAVTVTGGTGNTSGAGGLVSLVGGTPGVTGAGGGVTLTGQNGGATSGNGGAINITAGSRAAGSGTGGTINITAGLSSGSVGGAVNITGGGVVGATNAGSVNITGGTGPTGQAGNSGGAITIKGGPMGTNNAFAGNVFITGGAAAAQGSGGFVQISGAAGGATSGGGGSVNLNGGNATSGGGGQIQLQGGTGAGTNQSVGSVLANDGTLIYNALGTGTGSVGKIQFWAGASGTASGTTTHALVARMFLNGSVALTSAAAATIATPTIVSGSSSGGSITYCIECTDGTDYQALCGTVAFAITNKAASISGTTSILGVEALNVTGASTLVDTWAVTAAGLVQVTATTSLTPTYFQITYRIDCLSGKQSIVVPR